MRGNLTHVVKGFTLIEVVVVMAIVAILTAIALPNYWTYIARGNRSEARGQLLIASNWVERWRTQSGSYAGAVLPATLAQSPPPPGVAKYDITIAVTPVTSMLTATPVGVMAGDVCGLLTIDHTGARTPAAPPDLAQLCWGR